MEKKFDVIGYNDGIERGCFFSTRDLCMAMWHARYLAGPGYRVAVRRKSDGRIIWASE